MKKQPCFGSLVLAILLGLAGLVSILVRAFAPMTMLPGLDIPSIVLLAALAKVLEGWLKNEVSANPADILLAAVAFALLPWCAGLADSTQLLMLFLTGGVAYGLVSVMMRAAARRSSVKRVHKGALMINALLLFLACQSLSGVLL